jgi:hypothetical protein
LSVAALFAICIPFDLWPGQPIVMNRSAEAFLIERLLLLAAGWETMCVATG